MYYKTNSKYHSRKVTLDGITFASQHEAERYVELKLMEKAGVIRDLRLQPKYVVVGKHKRENGTTERSVIYRADFIYFLGDREIVEDAKGYKTKDYIIKRKLMLEKYGITIHEV